MSTKPAECALEFEPEQTFAAVNVEPVSFLFRQGKHSGPAICSLGKWELLLGGGVRGLLEISPTRLIPAFLLQGAQIL